MSTNSRAKGDGGLSNWRDFVGRQIKPPRRLKFTREGKYFTAMTLLIGFGAINTGNNLLYLLLGMMLSLIIASGVLSETVLVKMAVRRKLPERVFAQQATLVEVLLTNEKVRLPSFSIQITDRIVGVESKDRPAAYFMRVEAGGQEVGHYRFTWPRRGLWRFEGVEVATLFPFDLFRKSRDLDLTSEILVYPRPLQAPRIDALAAVPMGDVRRHKLGRGGDFYGLREYREDDDINSVHWKASAKRGTLVVREFEDEEARLVFICFLNRWDVAATDEDAHRERQEEAVGVCAGLAQRMLSNGFSVGLVALGLKVEARSGSGHFDRILRELALLDFVGDPRSEVETEALSFELSADEHCIVVGVEGVPAPGLAMASLLGEVRV